jgi:hypothetical protein
MRHLVGVVLAVVMAAAVFFVASWGYLKLLTRPGRLSGLPVGGSGGSLVHDHAALEGLAVLAAVGLLAGLLIALPRISPLATGLPGLALLAWTGLYLFSVRHAVQYVPLRTRAYGMGFEEMLFDGVPALAGLAMIVPLFVPSRWRRAPAAAPTAAFAAPAEVSTATFPALQATQTMATDDLFSGADPKTPVWPQPRINPEGPDGPGRSQAPWGPAEYS